MTTTSIEWTASPSGVPGKTWNPTRGCSLASPGCENCYAMNFAHRFSGPGKPFEGLTQLRKKGKGPVWTGEVRTIPDSLTEPLHWKTPSRIFVGSMSDIFHEDVSDAYLMRIWSIMAKASWHTFLVLTKRPERMAAWLKRWSDVEPAEQDHVMARGPEAVRKAHTSGRALMFAEVLDGMGEPPPGAAWPTYDWAEGIRWYPNVLSNVWLGTSIENQTYADKRVPALLQCDAALRFLSIEPLLGAIRLDPSWLLGKFLQCPAETNDPETDGCRGCPGHEKPGYGECHAERGPRLGWVIVGGESGGKARSMQLDWATALQKQCAETYTPFFFKQAGRRPTVTSADGHQLVQLKLKSPKGGDLDELPCELRVREFPPPSLLLLNR